MQIFADQFVPVDATSIPTGELASVDGTPFDFRQPTAIGARIDADDQQLNNTRGYDHTFVINGPSITDGATSLRSVAKVSASHRQLEVFSTEPGVQFYSGNFLAGDLSGKSGKMYPLRGGFCLETQHFPDSPNHPNFPSVRLNAGDVYETSTIFKFSMV
eukprot:TRINITY_DN1038_c0_g3_i1.p1 TRINITY_DN1038_c0_g3~~TRINITY_DN1038_c0_g3_i1.p1  ORF type:complete len:159 (-),score=46.04 TRINITY_DN1038_c0_g3_i1:103-579(-)